MGEGWIKLHRKFLDWEWCDSERHVKFFIHLLLMASHKERKYKGDILKPGEFFTSYELLSDQCKISISQLRTLLKNLKSTHELAVVSSGKGTKITILNWERYQLSDTQIDNEIAVKSQSNRSKIATIKNEKNEKNEKNIETLSSKAESVSLLFDYDSVFQLYPRKITKKIDAKSLEWCKTNIKSEKKFHDFKKSVENYAALCLAENTEQRYIKQFQTFRNCWKTYVEIEIPLSKYEQGLKELRESMDDNE